MTRYCKMLLMTPLLAVIFAVPAYAQVGRQPDRNKRPPATPPSGNAPSDMDGGAQLSDAQQHAYTEAQERLDRVFIAMNLRKPASPPFHMLVRVHYEMAGQALDGTYEIFWSGTQHYREIFQLGGAQEIDVAVGNKMYTSRTSVTVTLPLRSVRDLVKSPVPGNFMADYEVVGVGNEQIDGQTRMCIHVAKNDANTNQHANEIACFDPASNEIVSISAEGNYLNLPTKIELTSFKSLGGAKRYPTHMTTTVATENMPAANIEVDVTTLEDVTKFDDDPFAPPPGSTERDWCSTLAENPPPLEDRSQPSFPQDELKNLSEFFVLVGADGRVKQAEPVRAAADAANEQIIAAWLKTARFPIQNCGVTPVEYETFYTPALKRVY
jgi:hypothetical protein